jgi:hypothetical protein
MAVFMRGEDRLKLDVMSVLFLGNEAKPSGTPDGWATGRIATSLGPSVQKLLQIDSFVKS